MRVDRTARVHCTACSSDGPLGRRGRAELRPRAGVAVRRVLLVGRGARRPVLGATGGLQGATRWALLKGRDACVTALAVFDGIGRLRDDGIGRSRDELACEHASFEWGLAALAARR